MMELNAKSNTKIKLTKKIFFLKIPLSFANLDQSKQNVIQSHKMWTDF